jgi:hypothetical protein
MDRQTVRVAMMAGSVVAVIMALMLGFRTASNAMSEHFFDPAAWLIPVLFLVLAGVLRRFVPKA